MGTYCSPKIITDSLLVYLDAANQKSYPAYGIDKWGDMSRNGNHFNMWNNLINDDTAFLFPGNVNNYFSSNDFVHPVDKISVEMWVLPTADTAGDAFYSFVSNDAKTTYHSVSNQANLTIFGPNSSISTDISILDGKWKQIIRTSLRSTGAEKLYVNGNLLYETTLNPMVNFNQTGYVLLGQRTNTNAVLDPTYAYNGKIAVFKLYNKVLSDDEVKQNFNALKSRFNI